MSETKLSINPLDDVLLYVANAVEEWKIENTEDALKKTVKEQLDASAEEIVYKLLGFDNSWQGGYELDHCNGRNGESAAGDYLREVQAEAIKGWLSNIKIPKLSATDIKRIEAKAKEEYRIHLSRKVKEFAKIKATQDAEEIVQSVMHSQNIEGYLQLSKLINP